MARKAPSRKDPAERVIGALINLAHAIEYMAQKIPQAPLPIVAPVVIEPVTFTASPTPKPVSGIRYEELAAAVLKVAEAKGQAAAVEILKHYGVTHAKKLPEDKYAEALGAFEAALVAPVSLA